MIYAKEDRLTVPGTKAEGVITDGLESLPGFPVYKMNYLTDAVELRICEVGEGDLRKANPTEDDRALAEAEAEGHRNAREASFGEGVLAGLADAQARQRQLKRSAKKKTTKRKR